MSRKRALFCSLSSTCRIIKMQTAKKIFSFNFPLCLRALFVPNLPTSCAGIKWKPNVQHTQWLVIMNSNVNHNISEAPHIRFLFFSMEASSHFMHLAFSFFYWFWIHFAKEKLFVRGWNHRANWHTFWWCFFFAGVHKFACGSLLIRDASRRCRKPWPHREQVFPSPSPVSFHVFVLGESKKGKICT